MSELKFWPLVKRAYALVFGDLPYLFKITRGWLVIIFAIILAARLLEARLGTLSAQFIEILALTAAAAAMAVIWHRVIILEETPGGGELHFGRREFKYIGYGIAFSLAIYTPLIVFFFVPYAFMDVLGGRGVVVLMLVGVVLSIFAFVLFIRFMLVFPAVAVENSALTLKSSWHLLKGKTLRLFGGILASSLPLSLVHDLFSVVADHAFIAGGDRVVFAAGFLLLSVTAFFLSIAVAAGFLSLAYQEITPSRAQGDERG